MMKKILLLLTLVYSAELLSQNRYKEGYYFTKDLEKKSGLIAFNYGQNFNSSLKYGMCNIFFKENQDSKKLKLSTKDISCFVIEKDSFAIIRNFSIHVLAAYSQDFAQILESGRLSLYLYYATVYQGGLLLEKTYLLFDRNGITTKLNRKNFKELLIDYIKDYPKLSERVSSKELWYNDSRQIIKEYNEYFEQ